MRKAEKTGTAPVRNQMKAKRMTLITGVALKTVIRGLMILLNMGYRAARMPVSAPVQTIRIKLSSARKTVKARSVANWGEKMASSWEKTSCGVGRIIGAFKAKAPRCHRRMSAKEDRIEMYESVLFFFI